MAKRLQDRGETVVIDRHALHNACVASGITLYELNLKIGKSHGYLDMVFRERKGLISKEMYTQMKGILRVTDDSLIKAVPVERGDDKDASIISPYLGKTVPATATAPTEKKLFGAVNLDEENARFVTLLSRVSSRSEGNILNGIVRDYMKNSELGDLFEQLIGAIDRFDAV